MLDTTFTYDIETVPRKNLTKDMLEDIEVKVDNYFATRNGDATPEAKEKHRKMLMGTSPFYGMIVCIGIRLDVNGKFDKCCLTADNYSMEEEKAMLEDFWRIANKDRWTFVGYNSKAFDAYWIIRRSMFHGIKPTNRDFLDMYKFDTTHHFDLMLFLSDYDWSKKTTLKAACQFLGVPSPKEGEVKGENVCEVYEQGGLQGIADYCIRDIDATYSLYEKVKGYVYRKPKYGN